MMDQLRRPFLLAALALMALVVLFEVGSHFGLDPGRAVGRGADVLEVPGMSEVLIAAGVDPASVDPAEIQATADANPQPPGLAIPYQALVDGLLLFTVALMALPILLPERVTGRAQGIATFFVALIVIIIGIVLLLAAIGKLVLMLSLFLAPPFGTLAYLAGFGFFPQTQSLAVLGVLMAFKVAFCLTVVLAQQRNAQNKGLVLLVVTALFTNILIAFLHSAVPAILVSITDAIAAIIVSIVAIVWAVIMMLIAVVAVIRAVRVDRAMPASYGVEPGQRVDHGTRMPIAGECD
jgi:hypothetical protein